MAIPFSVEQVEKPVSGEEVSVTETDTAYNVKGKNFSFAIRKSDGILENYVYDGETLIKVGPAPSFWRGLLENDQKKIDEGTYDITWQGVENNISVQSIGVGTNKDGLKVITVHVTFPDAGDTKESIVYTVNGSGEITVDMTVDATESGMGNFLRVGSTATLPAGFEQITWYGNGPVKTFNDRKTGARQGIYHTTASEVFYPYVKADDSAFTDVVWMKLTNEKLQNSLLLVADDFVEASAMHFTPEDLNAADHPYKLSPREETVLSINYGSMGTGGATCGPATLPQYRLPADTVYNWQFTLMPVAADASVTEIGSAAAGYHAVKSYKTYDVFDASQSRLDTPLPATAEYVDGEQAGTTALKGYFTVDDPQRLLAKAMTNGKPFTVTARVYVPDEIFSTGSGTWEGSTKFNMLFSLDDKTFGMRVGTNTTRATWGLSTYVYNGSKWFEVGTTTLDRSLTDRWHDVAVTYSGTTLTLYLNGEVLAENKEVTASVVDSGYDFSVGYDPSKPLRKSELIFDTVAVYNTALTAAHLAGDTHPTDKNVVLWMDFEKIPTGDVDGDGTLRLSDVLTALKYSLGGTYLREADVNCDGAITLIDILRMLNMMVCSI